MQVPWLRPELDLEYLALWGGVRGVRSVVLMRVKNCAVNAHFSSLQPLKIPIVSKIFFRTRTGGRVEPSAISSVKSV